MREIFLSLSLFKFYEFYLNLVRIRKNSQILFFFGMHFFIFSFTKIIFFDTKFVLSLLRHFATLVRFCWLDWELLRRNKSEEKKYLHLPWKKETKLLDGYGFVESMKFKKLLKVGCSWSLWRRKWLLWCLLNITFLHLPHLHSIMQ